MKYEPYNYWNNRKNPNQENIAPKWMINIISNYLKEKDYIFELGPGIGRTFESYRSGSHVTTLDISKLYSKELTKKAQDYDLKLSQYFLSCSGERFPFESGKFSFGVCVQVLMHIPPEFIEHSMCEIARVCNNTLVIAGVDERWKDQTLHCFYHNYLAICANIGCVADEAFIYDNKICFILRNYKRSCGERF